MFNKYHWENYLRSGGRKIAQRFDKELANRPGATYSAFVADLVASYCPAESVLLGLKGRLADLSDNYEYWTFPGDEASDTQAALEYLWEADPNEENAPDDADYLSFVLACFPQFTTALSIYSPDHFVPYYFRYCYNVFSAV